MKILQKELHVLVHLENVMNKYLLRLLIREKAGRYHRVHRFSKIKDKDLLKKGIHINQKVREQLKMYSRIISNGNGLNGNGYTHHKDPKIQKLRYEIDKAELAVDKAYKEMRKAEIKANGFGTFLYNELGIEDDFYLFNLDFLRSYGLTDELYQTILRYNEKVIDYVAKYKKYIMALSKYEALLAEYAMHTEGIRPIDQKRWETKMAYREAEIQYANATIELRYELNKLLEAIKRLLETEHRFTTTKNKLEKLDIMDENVSQLQDEVIAAFYEYQDRLKDYYNARKSVSEKVRAYKEARMMYEIMQQEYEETLRDIMAN